MTQTTVTVVIAAAAMTILVVHSETGLLIETLRQNLLVLSAGSAL